MNMSSVVNKKFCQMKTTSTLWTRIPLLLTAALLASCLLTAWMAVHGFYINTCLTALLTLVEWLGIFALAFRSSSPISWRR